MREEGLTSGNLILVILTVSHKALEGLVMPNIVLIKFLNFALCKIQVDYFYG